MREPARGRSEQAASAPTQAASVVICAYTVDRWTRLQDAIASVASQSRPPDEVIVVIDHNDELLSLASDLPGLHPSTRLTVLPNVESRGLSGARNTGLRHALGDVVAFLDDDAVADHRWLESLVRHFETDEPPVGVGGLVLPLWDEPAPRWMPPEFLWVVGCSYSGLPTATARVRNPIGANMAFRRQAVLDVGGFSPSVGRLGRTPLGCEETELSIRLARAGHALVLHEPAAVVHHHVPSARARWSYFRSRCWAEGLSKAQVVALSDPRQALAAERTYVSVTLPRAVVRDLGVSRPSQPVPSRVAAATGGLLITGAGYVWGRLRRVSPALRAQSSTIKETSMTVTREPSIGSGLAPGPLHFNVHDRVGVRVDPRAPAARQLRTMLACFATDAAVPVDISIDERREPMPNAGRLEDELTYTDDALYFTDEEVQIVVDGLRYRIHGPGELLTSLVPVLDRAMTQRGASMIHAATMAYGGHGIALPAAGGTGKTSTVAKLMRREGWSFMGDDWAFLADDNTLLGYEKPMFIKPHHKAIYPHLFDGARKPLVPPRLSRSVGKVTTTVHPHIVRYPRLADLARRWSPEHRMIDARRAFPGREPTRTAPLAIAVYVERFEGARARLQDRTREWMVDRMMGNFHIEMAGFSQHIVASMAASSVIPWGEHVDAKRDVLGKALNGRPCYLLQVPSVYSADEASDVIVTFLGDLLPEVLPTSG